jgi:REP-associated tyrosine transposase
MSCRAVSGGSRRNRSATTVRRPVRRGPIASIIVVVHRPRVEVPGGYYHVCTRGNARRAIFGDDFDRAIFLAMLRRLAKRYGWSIYAYCLMTNHYHLLLQLSEGGLSRGMCLLNGGYASQFNTCYGRSNHLFGQRFWSDLLDHDAHLLASCRYVVLNPVRAGLADDAESWPWSSYRACAGHDLSPSFLATGELLELFGKTPRAAQAGYRGYVSEAPVLRQPPWRDRAAAGLR